jgi:hypothetical protein
LEVVMGVWVWEEEEEEEGDWSLLFHWVMRER